MMRHGIERLEALAAFSLSLDQRSGASGLGISEPLPSVKASLDVIDSNGIEIVKESDVGRG